VDSDFQAGDHFANWGDTSGVVVLIDGENTSSSTIGFVQSHAKRLGPLAFQYVFGNWGSPPFSSWRVLLESHQLEMCHHEPVASGKNATDINLVTFAMRLYYQGYRKFCMVASDSDYTPMLEFLRGQGCFVMLIGKKATPRAMSFACSVFIEIPVAGSSKKKKPVQNTYTSPAQPHDGTEQLPMTASIAQQQVGSWVSDVLRAYESAPEVWVHVPTFREYLKDVHGFKPQDHGFSHLLELFKTFPALFHLRPYKGETYIHEVRRAEC
jgi:hypothetical protein